MAGYFCRVRGDEGYITSYSKIYLFVYPVNYHGIDESGIPEWVDQTFVFFPGKECFHYHGEIFIDDDIRFGINGSVGCICVVCRDYRREL